ncbi:hypothetical protein J6590_098574 [Homalodisca vitripennis]|nr:hypothetical protein J6590_098574 [Homalodisca vitripennis]
MAVVNSWILHKTVSNTSLSQKEFRTQVALALMQLGKNDTPERGRPFNIPQPEEKRPKKSAAVRPPHIVTKDKTDHSPVWEKKRNRCKLENSKGKTNFFSYKRSLRSSIRYSYNSLRRQSHCRKEEETAGNPVEITSYHLAPRGSMAVGLVQTVRHKNSEVINEASQPHLDMSLVVGESPDLLTNQWYWITEIGDLEPDQRRELLNDLMEDEVDLKIPKLKRTH